MIQEPQGILGADVNAELETDEALQPAPQGKYDRLFSDGGNLK